ncbi:uncharacterized protein C3orf20-like [Heptranchias perlo]|uniref:uncharacterized protein C3orf20-like n=1 Tax=Heptranchias perlo TaxID=212740 RepID=UPI00355A001A
MGKELENDWPIAQQGINTFTKGAKNAEFWANGWCKDLAGLSSNDNGAVVPGKKKTKKKPLKPRPVKVSHHSGFTINFSVSSKACEDQGWIIKPQDESIAKLDWRTIHTLMLEKLQAENAKIHSQRKTLQKYGFGKPVILLHYEEARTEPLAKFRKHIPEPAAPVLKDGMPQIPTLKLENSALSKLHYALNDGSAIIYYPSGNIAVCRSHSGLSCAGAFYTNIFNDSALQPILLASFTPFGHGSVFLPGKRAMVLLFHEEGGLMIDDYETVTKFWNWPKRGKLPEPIWIEINEYITVRIIGQFAINFTYRWQYEFIRFPLSPLPNIVPPMPDEIRLSSVPKTADSPKTLPISEITIHYLRQLHRKIKSIVDDWMSYYRSETGLSKINLIRAAKSDPQIRKSQSATNQLDFHVVSANWPPYTDYIRFLSGPGSDKIKCLPRSCTFSRDLASYDIKESNISSLMASRRASLSRANIKHRLKFPKVPKEGKPWLRSPNPCPVALRCAMMGKGMKPCRCSTSKVPNITDLEFDTFIKRPIPDIQQIIVICVVSSQQLKPMPCERMIQDLYEEKNRNRKLPCVECRYDSFRVIKYDISTANDSTGQSSALLVDRHNVTPGMFLMYIRGKLLFADHIFNGYSNTVKDLKKQIAKTQDDYLMGHHLLYDFKFSSFESELPSTTLADRSWISQPDLSVRPKSENAIQPDTCIIQSSNRAATIQDFIAFSLAQRNLTCDKNRLQESTVPLETLMESCTLKPDR